MSSLLFYLNKNLSSATLTKTATIILLTKLEFREWKSHNNAFIKHINRSF